MSKNKIIPMVSDPNVLSGRPFLDLHPDRDPIEQGETIIDKLARDYQRRKRAEQAALDNSLIRPVPFPPR
ncbi:MAG: hypothetical protein BWY85_02315 [Firmicutes bacterium ADurb.Bin506]|nr:MAG: hypothetical protein BWY85_02315 [Firmicutes bacterium ADurb.Bin506]